MTQIFLLNQNLQRPILPTMLFDEFSTVTVVCRGNISGNRI
uniref:Uncharacterized protein n=1 Tax=Rhizobium leguminosarum bv. viciae TaxID=387 RepID=A0A0U3IH77_RHILV|nr:hypothetical protein [Rhizobium leguminosarum bv. viciae]